MKMFKRQWTVVSGQWSENKEKLTTQHSSLNTGFTLMELLVVIAIMGMLAGILLPTLNKARERAHRVVCVGNLKVIGEAFNMYNIDRGEMPPTVAIDNLATNIIKIAAGDRVGIGYFYNDPILGITTDDYIDDFAVFVCPESDHIGSAQELKGQWANPSPNAVSSYIYRAKSGYGANDTEDQSVGILMLSDAKPAIVMDYNDISNAADKKYNHKGEYVNILFRNGYVKGVENKNAAGDVDRDGKLTLLGVAASRNALFKNADAEQ